MDRMSIGAFARATGLTPKALRLYDEMGRVRPADVDEFSGYRYYRAEQLGPARLVARIRLIGTPLERIRVIAELPSVAQAAELVSYWRQVEADTSSRPAMLAVLVEELRAEERHADQRHEAADGGCPDGHRIRDSQLDVVLTGVRVYALAEVSAATPTWRDACSADGPRSIAGPAW